MVLCVDFHEHSIHYSCTGSRAHTICHRKLARNTVSSCFASPTVITCGRVYAVYVCRWFTLSDYCRNDVAARRFRLLFSTSWIFLWSRCCLSVQEMLFVHSTASTNDLRYFNGWKTPVFCWKRWVWIDGLACQAVLRSDTYWLTSSRIRRLLCCWGFQ